MWYCIESLKFFVEEPQMLLYLKTLGIKSTRARIHVDASPRLALSGPVRQQILSSLDIISR